MGRGVGDGKSGQNRKPEAFLQPQRKIKKSTFFPIFFGPDLFGPEIGPWNCGRVKIAPPNSRLRTSGPGRVRNRKKWSKTKTGRVFEFATKNKNFDFFAIFLVPIFSDPKFGRVVGGGPPRGSPGQGGSARRTGKFHFSVDFESYGAVHTTFATKTMV